MSAPFSPTPPSHGHLDGSDVFWDERPAEKPSNPVWDFLGQHRGESTEGLFEILSGNFSAAAYRERPINVPPLAMRDGRLVYTDHEFPDEKSQWTILGLMQRLCNTQRSVSSQRYARHRQRVDMKLKRDEAADVGTDLTNKLNALVPELSVLQEYSNLCVAVIEILDVIERFQQLRDEYQAQESDYREDEKRLDREEFRLEEVENDFQSKLDHIDRRELTALFGDYASSHGDARSTPSTPEVEEEYHPLVYEYLSNVGHGYDLREELWEVSTGRQALLQEQEARRQDGLGPDEGALAHLNDLEQNERKTLEELAQVDKEIQRLGVECEIQGLDINQHNRTDYEDEVKPDLSSSLTAVDLQQSWREKGPTFFEGVPEISQSIDIARFIDKWILDQLCHSSFEVLVRKSVEDPADTKLKDNDSLTCEKEEAFRDLVMGSWAEDMVPMSMPPPTEELEDQLAVTSNGFESIEEQDAGQPQVINNSEEDRDNGSTAKKEYNLEHPDIPTDESNSRRHCVSLDGFVDAGREISDENNISTDRIDDISRHNTHDRDVSHVGDAGDNIYHRGCDNPNINATIKDDNVGEKNIHGAKPDHDEHADDAGKLFDFEPDVPEYRDRDNPLGTLDPKRKLRRPFGVNFFPAGTVIRAREATLNQGYPLSQSFHDEISESEISSSYRSNTLLCSSCHEGTP